MQLVLVAMLIVFAIVRKGAPATGALGRLDASILPLQAARGRSHSEHTPFALGRFFVSDAKVARS